MRIRHLRHTTTVLSAAIAALLFSACVKKTEPPADASNASGSSEVQWARAALERNPQLEVLAADEQKRVITVRQRSGGEVMAVRVDEIGAAPVALLRGTTPSTAVAPATTSANTPVPDSPLPAEEPLANAAPPPEAAPPAETPVAGEGNYTIQREGGQLRVSGPGVSIVSANSAGDRRAQTQNSPATTPIVCDGARFMHLDQRNLTVEGTAVIARNGCELHITNTRIRASGAALSVQNATVHVANSELTGQTASLEALGRARLFIRGSTFDGISRRDETAELNDQGGNTWR